MQQDQPASREQVDGPEGIVPPADPPVQGDADRTPDPSPAGGPLLPPEVPATDDKVVAAGTHSLPPLAGAILERVKVTLSGARTWQIVAAVAIFGFGFLWTRQGEPLKPLPDGLAMAKSWTDQMSRLDIQPVYPPSEDFAVGDILVAVAEEGNPLVGKSIRVGHIPMRDYIADQAGYAPRFEETLDPPAAVKDEPSKLARQPDIEVATAYSQDKIALKLVAFPGLDLGRSDSRGVGAGAAGFGAETGAAASETNHIHMPMALTYGVRPDLGYGQLVQWCGDPDHAAFCTDDFARRVLSFALGPSINEKEGGRYKIGLQVMIVTRVYLTREIAVSRQQNNDRGMKLGSIAQAGISTGTGGTTDAGKDKAFDVVEPSGRTHLDSMRLANDNQSLEGVFLRPLVFGFRSINQAIPRPCNCEQKP